MHLDYGAEESAPRRQLGRASLAGAASIYQQCIALASGLLVARLLGASQYGVIMLARNLIDNAWIFTRLGLDLGLQRYFGEANLQADRGQRVQVLRQVRLVAAAVAVLPPIALALGLADFLQAHVYVHAHFAPVLLCLALALPFVTDLAVLGGAYRGVLRLGPAMTAESVLLPTARLLLMGLLFLAGWRLWAVVLGTTLGSVLAAGWLWLRARRDFASPPAATPSWREARHVLRYSRVLGAAVLVTTLTATMDVLTLGHFGTAAEVGQYTLAKTLVALLSFVSLAFTQGLGGLIAERYFRGDRAGVVRVVSQAFRWVALGTLPMFAIFLLWGAQLTPLFGASFTISQSVVAWLAMAQFATALLGTMGWTLSMTGHHVLELRILLAGLLLSALLCALAVPAYGQLGAAIATCTAVAFANGLRLYFVRRTMGAWPVEAGVLRTLALGLGLALGLRLLLAQLPLPASWSALLGIACFLPCWAAMCWPYLRGELPGRMGRAIAGHG
jgi:O-antigen/teichoic acid export membrane protein